MIAAANQNVSAGLFNAPAQGIKRGLDEAGTAAQKIAQGDMSPSNFTALIQADIAIKANRVVAVTADEMIGTLLNRKA